MLQEHLARYKDVYQYVYLHVFPEVYTTSEKRGFDMKSNFHILFKAYRDKMVDATTIDREKSGKL